MVPGNQADDHQVIAEGENEERGVEYPHQQRPEVADVEEELEERAEELHSNCEMTN